jgi:hypothetical protein
MGQQAVRQRIGGRAATKTGGRVVIYSCGRQRNPRGHESMTRRALARRLAALKGFDFAGDFDPANREACPYYFVPDDTLYALDLARDLGILCEHDMFGGVVPHPFVATKTITHPLVAPGACALPGWTPRFARAVRAVVLPGFSVFSLEDARQAGASLLQEGAVRLKLAGGIGGLGQSVAETVAQLEAQLQALDADMVAREGLVLERNLVQVVTYSVGQVRVGKLLATYHGTQRLTSNNRGEQVYGGSELTVVRGDFDALQRLGPPPNVQTAIAQARKYHNAAKTAFPGMFASRANYDIAQGVDDQGQWRSGVLEQSWRIGGASGAEVAALEAFRDDPSLRVVQASTTEVYGANARVPSGAHVVFQGIDQHVGPLTKYSQLESHAHP